MALNSRSVSQTSKLKMVKETTTFHEHKCTADCFKPRRKRNPPNLRRVSLGYIYMSSDGRFYCPWGDEEWLSVEGVDFLRRQDGELIRMFRPVKQLHIHSRGGRTISKVVTRTQAKPGADYFAQQAAKKLRSQGASRRDTNFFLAREVGKIIPRAPKRRQRIKGTGRGAPGKPRSPFSKQVVALRENGIAEVDIVDKMMSWLRSIGKPATPLHRAGVKKTRSLLVLSSRKQN